METDIYKRAAILKLRFNFRGPQPVEDLYDLSIENLDTIYRVLRAQQQAMDGDSLLARKTLAEETLDLQIQIIKDIVATKQANAAAQVRRVEKLQQKHRILEVIAEKQDESLKGKSLEELQAMAGELDDDSSDSDSGE